MEEIITFELIKGAYVPILGALILLAGYFVTDHLYLHQVLLFLNGNKAYAVALASLPIAVAFVATGTSWESALITYLSTNGLYDNILKHLKP